MKKLLEKDKLLRFKNVASENRKMVLKSIFKNLNFFTLIRWNAFIKLQNLSSKSNKYAVVNRCVYSVNKKRFNKLTNFSRHIFLKLIRTGQIHGMKKSSW
jgi:ribosomal protein S14